MKLSFSLSSKPSSRTNPSRPLAAADDQGREFITVFDPSQTLAADAPSKLVIPPIPNTFNLHRPPKKAKYMPPLPSSDAAAKFVLHTSGEGPASHIAYGLTVRSSSAADPKPSPDDRGDSQSNKSRASAEDSILRRFKEDMKTLPEDRGLDEFKDVPVEGFGAAILAGYGWSEGKGIGRNNSKGDIKVVQYKRRTGTAGLGYNPSTADPKKKRGEWVFNNDNKVYKILQYIEFYQKENKLGPIPIILCGDLNGSKRAHVYKFLRSQHYVSSYDTAHHYTDGDADAHKPSQS